MIRPTRSYDEALAAQLRSEMSDSGGRVISVPERKHVCAPGWAELPPVTGHPATGDVMPLPPGMRRVAPPSAYDYPAGTVWECACGKTWVSKGRTVRRNGVSNFADFRPERRLERWRRTRGRVTRRS